MPLRTYTLDFPDLGDAGVTSSAEFTLQVGEAGADGETPTRRFQLTLRNPTVFRDIPWVSGPITLASLTLCMSSGTADDVTLSVNGTPVPGWVNLTADTTPATHPPDDPVALANGDVVRVFWSGTDSDLSLGFSE